MADPNERRMRVLAMRKGGYTYAAIALEYGVSTTRIRQIEREGNRTLAYQMKVLGR